MVRPSGVSELWRSSQITSLHVFSLDVSNLFALAEAAGLRAVHKAHLLRCSRQRPLCRRTVPDPELCPAEPRGLVRPLNDLRVPTEAAGQLSGRQFPEPQLHQ